MNHAEIKYRQNKRAKYLRISVKPFRGVSVTVPYGVSLKEARKFVDSKQDWIEEQKRKIDAVEKKHETVFSDNEKVTKNHVLKLIPQMRDDYLISINETEIKINFPIGTEHNSDRMQSVIKWSIVRALKKEASEYIPRRVKEFAEKLNLSYNNIRLKNIKTRWGSCSNKNNLNFSVHLMQLPNHLIDYVILHELAHTIEKNHSVKFWKLLDSFTGNAKKLDKELKKYRINPTFS
ncbi:MAG: M48 family metallopeptidase [Melioribacteraceae bacterium]|nr:M48 family metallopeptidase [Melioribacteraceae bacterium]MCF8356138.1 M48 family metallopeptidase [Melioribacteraceae bacterium]MCF8395486.1 M48 family metallopeptidase [Melioribacteraceae bacterium]MCF8420826.1 M48 family metallopeptidase [Melioribacteraceae bacterium]